MGEVVGEAWGCDFLHQLGHAIGTVLVVGMVSLAGWLVLRDRVAWASRWAVAGAVGSVVGLALYVPILALAREALGYLTIALTLHLPLLGAAVSQTSALRHHVPRPARWAVAWSFGLQLGVAVAWFAGGCCAPAVSVHPVFEKAVAYWWAVIPSSMAGRCSTRCGRRCPSPGPGEPCP